VRFRFDRSDLEVRADSSWEEDRLGRLAGAVFSHWEASPRPGLPNEIETRLGARLVRRTDGRSEVAVYELTFHDLGTTRTQRGQFIIRAHPDNGAALASREYDFVQRIMKRSTASDFFSAQMLGPLPEFPQVVVYHHAASQLGSAPRTLTKAISDKLEVSEARKIADRLGPMLKAVTGDYADLGDPGHVRTGERYFIDAIADRLLPDVLIDGPELRVRFDGTTAHILDEVGGRFSDDPETIRVTGEQLRSRLSDDAGRRRGWISLVVDCESKRVVPGGLLLRLKAQDTRLWLRIPESAETRAADWSGLRRLVFLVDRAQVDPSVERLKDLDFPLDAVLSTRDFGELCAALPIDLYHRCSHTDLHGGNVLWADGALKAIDLGSAGHDLFAVAHARLETSVWCEADAWSLDAEEVDKIVGRLDSGTPPDSAELSPSAAALHAVLHSIRSSLAREIAGAKLDRPELQVALAYATQILLHQRYAVEQSRRVGDAFKAISGYWLRRFRRLISEPALPAGGAGTELAAAPAAPVELGRDSLLALWREAMISMELVAPAGKAEELLEKLLETDPLLDRKPLTEFQTRLLVDSGERDDRPFQSQRNVILSGPTGCGKSTAAEMFLVGPWLFNQTRKAALYIAPTRALTQAKYRELQMRFARHPKLSAELVVSTGEDTDHDWRINHGEFLIACMVYEKANILFSRNRKLLDRLGCLVVDEMHMMANLERGPILETVLTKILRERARIAERATRGPSPETIRVVAISTEDQTEDPIGNSLREFLTVVSADRLEPQPPLLFSSTRRPVPVWHKLILPGVVLPGNQQGEDKEFAIVKFEDGSGRKLSPAAVRELDKNLRPHVAQRTPTGSARPRSLEKVLDDLLLRRLADNERGYRVLVFLPGRGDVENRARQLRKKLAAQGGGQPRHQRELDPVLKTEIDRIEDKKMQALLKDCALAGIFVHHAEIDRKVRQEIERVCADMPATAPSEVIFATETLTYGVNLAVQDVVIAGTTFYTQTRRRDELLQDPLPIFSLHNMAGRAGRLGKVRDQGEPNVFIVLPSAEDALPTIKNYYMKVDPPISQIYVNDDRTVQERLLGNKFSVLHKLQTGRAAVDAECAQYASLGAMDFSYPLVRTILDSLRHLNMEGVRADDHRIPTSYDRLMEFLSATLYHRQFATTPKEVQLFRCAVKRILDSCTESELGLVKASRDVPPRYVITERGEAAIDTGTELQTVQPLIALSQHLHQLWLEEVPRTTPPPELFLLSVLAPEEVARQFIRETPECKGNKPWPDQLMNSNRDNVLQALVASLRRIASEIDDAIATRLAARLQASLVERGCPEVKQAGRGYSEAATDGLLRLFNGMVAWINLDERAKVNDLIEGRELPDNYRGQLERFHQLKELLHFKTKFLAKILVTDASTASLVGPETERQLHLLTNRLRLGCPAPAIPLFWPTSSALGRADVRKLVAAGLSADLLLASQQDSARWVPAADVAPSKITKLRTDLEGYAAQQLQELGHELTVIHSDDAKRKMADDLWRELHHMFKKAVSGYRATDERGVGFDDELRRIFRFGDVDDEPADVPREQLNPGTRDSLDRNYQLRVEVPEAGRGTTWIGDRLLEDEALVELLPQPARQAVDPGRHRDRGPAPIHLPRRPVRHARFKLLGLEIRAGWRVKVGSGAWQSLAAVLEREQSTEKLVIVCLPWSPPPSELPDDARAALDQRATTAGYTTTLMTPAALGMMVSTIVRDFVSAESYVKLLTTAPRQGAHALVSVREILTLIDDTQDRQIAPAIREKLVPHFEIAFRLG
jgi:hypothetical protein